MQSPGHIVQASTMSDRPLRAQDSEPLTLRYTSQDFDTR
jgi:hypothetical protein